MQQVDHLTTTPEAPPRGSSGAFVWVRKNLFGSIFSSILTLVICGLIIWFVPSLVEWALIKAVWPGAGADACRAASGEGACWAVIGDKWRLIIFGRYPFDEHWRPTLAMLVLMGTVLVSCDRRFWSARLIVVWILGMLVFLWLMGGGFGLTSVPTGLWGGLPLTMMLAFFGMVVAFPLAILLALGRRSSLPLIKVVSVVYIELIRGVPLISLLFMGSFLLPLFMPAGTTIDAVLRAQIAIILFQAAYLAETIRGGLQALPKGQSEAADALALGYWKTQLLIVLPQALKISIPPIVGSLISLFKDTSLVAIVSLSDLLLSMRQAMGDPVWRPFFVEAFLFIMLIYWAFCFSMSKYSQYLERTLETGHRRR
ncbi:amino acid ABC transporter membrane protein 2, PAAT family [Arboricoccus pini]|uniref:Amino acid ABC transporter membrane protein 2, PAAT family n=1 Tax=Arboricoccus pini TaxID=1963835 RepID=A0A212QNI5_9PROT|nr:amino acid ABC transporter permease [Arboricoccus pini]SNB60791.1 amino acid ABC transporter membrane protein 2, PAAT family [Arboricoccus pini]